MSNEQQEPDFSPLIPPRREKPREMTDAQRSLIVLIIALAAASLAFRVLVATQLRHTAAVFIGIPTLLALIVASREKPATGTGVVMRVITLALLMSSIVFAEGMVCILLAAPIFYLVGYVMTKLVQSWSDGGPRGKQGWTMLALIILPTGMEGVLPGFEWDREESVSVVRVVPGTPAEVSAALAGRPGFAPPLPPFLRLGFPVPVATGGSGLEVGDVRTIVFAHKHGGHEERGTLSFRIAERDSQFVRFTPTGDDSYVTHWLSWRSSEVRWEPVSSGATRITWTLRYRRRLDPAWYFAPLERFGVGIAAGYLIESLAAPGVAPSSAPVAHEDRASAAHEAH